MTDLTPILIQALSNDNNVRCQAEDKLKMARNQNLPMYLVTLVLILANDKKPQDSRQMAGILLKNELKGRSIERQRTLTTQWNKIDPNLQQKIRNQVLNTLHSKVYDVRKISARVLSSIASIDLMNNKWVEVIKQLNDNVTKPKTQEAIESSLMALGYLCENCTSPVLRQHSNDILTAVFHGMRNNTNMNIKLAGTESLFNCLEFASGSFQKQDHRNFIMKCIMENAICTDPRVRKSALECLVQIVFRFYNYVGFYIDPLTKLTTKIALEDVPEVGMQAVEFWSTLAEVEADIVEEIDEATEFGRPPKRKYYGFAKARLPQICGVLTNLLVKQTDELDAWNIAAASGTCLSLVSHVVGDSIVKHVMPFIIQNINNPDWHKREAATLAFSAIVDGPKSEKMGNLVNSAIPHLLRHVKDQIPIVKDTSVFCLGRIAKFQAGPLIKNFLNQVLQALLFSMKDIPSIAEKACWALLNIANAFKPAKDDKKEVPTNNLAKYFQNMCESLLLVTVRPDVDTGNLRLNAYECLTTIISVATQDCYTYLDQRIVGVLIQRLFQTVNNTNQNDKEKVFLIQGLLCGALEHITEKLSSSMSKYADNLMRAYLMILKSDNSAVIEEVLMAIGSLSSALDDNFFRYMDSFHPFLVRGLQNQKEDDVCVASIWCVVDISYAIKKKLSKYSDDIIRVLLTNLQSSDISRDIKPLIISCFGDIAMAIGQNFQKYVYHIAAVLKNAANAEVNRNDEEMVEYLNTLREHIFDTYIGILQGVKKENYNIFNPFVKPMIEFIGKVYKDEQTDQEVIIKACSAIGDLVNVYGSKCKDYINFPFIKNLIHECSNSSDKETKKAASWTKTQIKSKIQ